MPAGRAPRRPIKNQHTLGSRAARAPKVPDGGFMHSTRVIGSGLAAAILAIFALPAGAQSFKVQCPTHTSLPPLINAGGQTGKPDSTLPNPHIKCQQVSGGDGFATMGDGTQ